MNSIIVLILTGFIIGTFGTLIGAGGGFILVPLLLLTNPHLSPDVVTAISMAVVAANALSGSIAYARAKRIDYKAGLLFAACTIPGSIAGVFVVKYIPRQVFDVIFGLLLMALSVYLFVKNRKNQPDAVVSKKTKGNLKAHTLTDKQGKTYTYTYNQNYGILISIAVGFISPILGIGGGIVHVPALVQWLQFPVYIATATSHFILAIMSTVSVAVHIYQGSYTDHQTKVMAVGLCVGVIPGAQFGAYLSHKMKTAMIIKILAVCLGIVGLRILLQAVM